jgi:hypothetical protein
MPDQGTIDSIASKFEAWAAGLPPDEQRTLAQWWNEVRGDDVVAHSNVNWWQESGAWSRAWSDSWSS